MGMVISHRIKKLRTERNISQKKLAEAVGVDRRAIIFWEQGINEPKASYIKELALFFNVSADYLLGIINDWKIKTILKKEHLN